MQQAMPESKAETSAKREYFRQLLVVLVASTVLFANLGGARLWDRDEPRNAGCALEMRERGDWIVPVFNGELRAHKPVLTYWLIMSAYAVFGVNEFAARFWSAALGVGTVWATYGIGRRLFHPQVGLWAGLILSTSLMFDVASRAATPDAALIFFSTVAILAYVMGTAPRSATEPRLHFPRSWLTAAWMYAMMGMAVLAKGPVGFVLPAAVIGLFALIAQRPSGARPKPTATLGALRLRVVRPACTGQNTDAPAPSAALRVHLALGLDPRRWAATVRSFLRHFLATCWAMRPFTAVAVLCIVALPWYVWVSLRTDGQFLRGFFLEHHLHRATQPMEGHSGSLLFYPAALLVGFFPWSVFAVPALIELVVRVRNRDPWRAGYVLACCWVGVYVTTFSLAATKLANYVTPCYPALALVTGGFLYQWLRGAAISPRLWQRLSWATLGLVGIVLLVGLPLATKRFLPGEWQLGLLGLVPLAGALLALWCAETHRRRAALLATAVAAILFVMGLFGWALPRVDQHQQNHQLLAAIDHFGVRPQVGAYGCLEPTWIFYGGDPITELTLAPTELPTSSDAPWQPKPRRNAAEFFGESEEQLIITTDRHWSQLRAVLPPNATVLADCPRFLKSGRLLLIGRVMLQAQRDTIRE
jgi:4-amino-4-deoxy-L-arabinose transferase-like glycosyltransferase